MTDTVKVTVPVEYVAWATPECAHIAMPPRPRQEGFQPSTGIDVEQLPPAALDALAKQWLDHLYAKVGRGSPFRLIGGGQ